MRGDHADHAHAPGLHVPCLAKAGYRVDGGEANEREHLWFQVHRLAADRFEGTLLNQPFHIQRLHQGQRGEHDLELLSDWSLMTPCGPINPRSLVNLRVLRALPPEAIAEIRKQVQAG